MKASRRGQGWKEIVKEREKENMSIIKYIFLNEGKIKSFSDQQKLREFVYYNSTHKKY